MNEYDETLYEAALEAIRNAHEGTSSEETATSLQGLRDEIDVLIESCE